MRSGDLLNKVDQKTVNRRAERPHLQAKRLRPFPGIQAAVVFYVFCLVKIFLGIGKVQAFELQG